MKFTSNLPPAKREKLLENLDRYFFTSTMMVFEIKNKYSDFTGMETDVSVQRSSEPCFT